MDNKFDPDAYLAATSPKSGGFNPDAYLASTDPSYLEKTASNVIPDIGQLLVGLANTVKKGAYDMPTRAMQTGIQMAGGVPYSQTPSGQTDTQLVQNAPTQAKELVRPVTHPIDYFQEHPVQQLLNGLAAGSLASKGAGAALNAVPLTENVLPSLERVANNQTLKGFGGSIGQLKQMEAAGGRPALDAAAQFARENGLSDVLSSAIGREKSLNDFLQKSGAKLGALRTEAGAAPADVINQVVDNPLSKMNEYLGEGLASKELPTADLALEDIKRIGGQNPTHARLADAATYINKKAAGNKLYQPVTAATDVANALSDVNNQGIAQSLGSDKAAQYVQALQDQQTLHPLEHLQQHGELRAAGGRGGIGLQMVQKLADEFGYRLAAKTAANIHDILAGQNTGAGVTNAAIANNAANIASSPQSQEILNLINQLKQKYDQKRQM